MQPISVEQAVRADPDDAAAWHAYSGWLLERGDDRGRLIRLEQRLTRVRPVDRPALEREIADLVAAHAGGWDDGLPPTARVLTRRYGFPTEVAVTWSGDVRAHVEKVLAGPFVTTLRIIPKAVTPVDGGALAGVDLGRLTGLDLAHLRLGADGAGALAASLRTGRLRALDLRYCGVGDDGLRALAESAHLTGLRRLHLQRNQITADGVRHLHRFPALTEVDLRYNTVGAAGVEALLAAPFVGGLTRLWLYDCDVGEAGVRRLAAAGELPTALRNTWRCR